MSYVDLAERTWFANCGDYNSNWIRTNQIKGWLLVRMKTEVGIPVEQPLKAE